MNNVLGQFKIYPRGFLGAKLEPMLERKRRPAGRLAYDITLFDPADSKSVVANLAVEELYQNLARNDLNARKFEFQERVMQEVMWAFGTMNFAEWYKAQFQSPSFGPLHAEFLDDTIGFLMTGKRRQALQNWDVLLDEGEKKVYSESLSPNARTFFGTELMTNLREPYDVVEVVQQWLRQPRGFTDMLVSAHILFGMKG